MTKNKSSLQKKKKAASLKLRKTAGFWRRVRDSNPRSLSEHDFSRVAPSTTRTTLQYISKHQASEIPRKKERTDGENYGIKFSDLSCENKSNQWFRLLCYHISTTLSSLRYSMVLSDMFFFSISSLAVNLSTRNSESSGISSFLSRKGGTFIVITFSL